MTRLDRHPLTGYPPFRPLEELERCRKERDALRDALTEIREIAEGYEDGAPDAPAYAKAMNRIAAIAAGEVVP